MPVEKVKFKSGGIHCAGDLYIRDGRRSGSRGPAVVMGHGFSFVKEALVEDAGYLQRAGYVVLTSFLPWLPRTPRYSPTTTRARNSRFR